MSDVRECLVHCQVGHVLGAPVCEGLRSSVISVFQYEDICLMLFCDDLVVLLIAGVGASPLPTQVENHVLFGCGEVGVVLPVAQLEIPLVS